MRFVVYTAIAGGYDTLRPQPTRLTVDTDFVAFVDEPALVGDCPPWRRERLDDADPDPVRRAKRYKLLPHVYFPEAEYSLWIDGNVSLLSPYSVPELAARFLDGVDLCVFRHPQRSCLYAEAEVCKHKHLDDPSLINRQVRRYRAAGLPPKSGLIEATVLLRRHTPAMARLDEFWWEEIRQGSRRDQLSFNYLAWREGFRYGEFPGTIRHGNEHFTKSAHALPRRTFG